MESYRIEEFIKGWVVGNFSPSLHRTSEIELAIKFYEQGEVEGPHMQKVATEITIVVHGIIRMGSQHFQKGDIVAVPPGEIADFEALTNSSLVCVKFPSIPEDKIIVT